MVTKHGSHPRSLLNVRKAVIAAITLAVLTSLASRAAAADRITLTNGDVLTGEIRAGSSSGLSLATELVGPVDIKWTAVSQVASTAPVRATLVDQSRIEGVLTVTDGRVSVRRADGSLQTIGVSELRALQPASAAPDGAGWHGSLNADFSGSRGNAETSTLSTTVRSTRLGQRDKLGLFGTHLFSANGSGVDEVTTARTTRAGARYDHDVSGALYGFGFTDVENDPLQLLDLRLVAGGGLGLHLLNRGATQLNVYGGISYARDAYAEETETTVPETPPPPAPSGPPSTPPGQGGTPPGRSGGRPSRGGTPPATVRTSLSRSVSEIVAGQDLIRQLSDALSLTESLTVFPAMGDFEDYRVSFDVTLSAQISSWMQWNLSVSDRYLHIPPAGGAVQNDTFISTGVGITFGRTDVGGFSGADRPSPRR